MDWQNNLRNFVPRPQTSLNFLYNYDHHSDVSDKKYAIMEEESQEGSSMDRLINYGGHQEKKKRLTSEQLESLERCFQQEIKLEPDRKMKLSRELGLQPRQIAVWFQNRRARWKTKQLERLYEALKLEFDIVSKEKQKLQEEVMKLQTMLRQQATRKQVSTGYTEISGEETVESTSIAIHSSAKTRGMMMTSFNQIGECNYLLGSVDEYNPSSSSPYWAVLPPSYP